VSLPNLDGRLPIPQVDVEVEHILRAQPKARGAEEQESEDEFFRHGDGPENSMT
jgi:hypothetical protein